MAVVCGASSSRTTLISCGETDSTVPITSGERGSIAVVMAPSGNIAGRRDRCRSDRRFVLLLFVGPALHQLRDATGDGIERWLRQVVLNEVPNLRKMRPNQERDLCLPTDLLAEALQSIVN